MAKKIKGKTWTRKEVAEHFDIALTTVDAWVRKGCPVVKKGGKGVPSVYDSAAVFNWCVNTNCGQPTIYYR